MLDHIDCIAKRVGVDHVLKWGLEFLSVLYMSKPNSQSVSLEEATVPTPPGVPETDLRVQLATERTLLAWMRTGLALMAFGFVVARFSLVMESMGVRTSEFLTLKATIIGVILVALGITVNIAAPVHYRAYFKRIDENGKNSFIAWSLTMFVAYSMAVLGIALAIYLLLVEFGS